MNPQDGRSILQQQRWIEVYNAGGTEIPAYGAVEITGNTADATEFLSYLSVQQPTKDGCPHILINSHVPIAAGKTGWATRDFPAYALCESVGSGRMVGSQAGSYELQKDVPGFLVCGTGRSGALRVDRNYTTQIEAELGSELCPGAATASISGAEECEGMEITSALNLFNLAGPAGSPCSIWWSNKSQDWVVTQVKHRVWHAVTDIYSEPDECAIYQSRYKQMAGMWCSTPVDEVAVQFFSSEVVVDVYTSDTGSGIAESCKLKQDKKTICTLNDISGQAANPTTAMNFNLIEVIVDVNLNEAENKIQADTWYIFVPCDDPGRTVDLIDLTPCDTSSS